MSNMLYSKFDEDAAGCCNFLRILDNPNNPLLQSSHFSRSDFRQEDDPDDVCYNTLFNGGCGGGNASVPCAPKVVQTCRKIPVKETAYARRIKHMNGRNMINEYVKERKINQGSYGKVALYRNINDGTPYAIKTICKSRLRKLRVTLSENAMHDVLREILIMKRLDHENIVKLVEVIDDEKSDYLYMVLEYVEGSCINNLSEARGRIDERTARGYFKDIIAGLIYLHNHNVVHGDIKPENLLVTGNGRVKIGDFSFSHQFEDENDELCRCPGTPAFTAPECCSDRFYGGKAADTWAAGVTLYCLVVGCCPFLADSVPETYDKIINAPLSLPENLSPELKDLLQGLLCKDPMQRITLHKAAEHPWMVKKNSSCCRLNSL